MHPLLLKKKTMRHVLKEYHQQYSCEFVVLCLECYHCSSSLLYACFCLSAQDAALTERILKFIDVCLKSTHLPTKISSLYGCLYLLETGVSEVTRSLVPVLSEYLLRSLTNITPYVCFL